MQFGQARLRTHQLALHPLHDAFTVARLAVPAVFRMPEVEYLGGQEAILAPAAMVMQPQHQVGIFMAPPAKAFVETVHGFQVTIPDSKVAASNSLPAKAALHPPGRTSPTREVGQFVDIAAQSKA